MDITTGNAPVEITQFAKATQVDLIIVSTRGPLG